MLRAISIHALREEGDGVYNQISNNAAIFLSTPSAKRATYRLVRLAKFDENFYPRPPRRGRLLRWQGYPMHSNFYPRPPRGGRPPAALPLRRTPTISIHALREEGDALFDDIATVVETISIHALREEGDDVSARWLRPKVDFYPRPPRGGRLITTGRYWQTSAFLSTPSARRATSCCVVSVLTR